MNGMEAFRLVAKLMLDKSDYEKGMSSAEMEAKSQSSKIGTALGAAGKVASGALNALGNVALVAGKAALAGIGTAAGAVGTLVVQSTKAYASFEQLSGGISKLYGTAGQSLEDFAKLSENQGLSIDQIKDKYESLEIAQDTVMNNANRAWLTAGMSANKYMESVTGFSAALLESAGDSITAAEMADTAMQDIADNANTFGKFTAEELTNVYQALAKGQYQTLDNLSLGFGGTKEGMQALIDKANEFEKANGRAGDLSIESYADIVQAIHDVQVEMKIAGTTQNEAMKTIEGSVNATKAAWENLKLSIGKGEGIGDAIKNLSTAIFGLEDDTKNETGLLNQLIPRIQEVMKGIGEMVAQAGPIIAEQLPVLLESLLPGLLQSTRALVQSLIQSLPEILGTILEYLPEFLNLLVETTLELLPVLIDGLIQLAGALVEAIPQILPTLVVGLMVLTIDLIQKLIEDAPKFLEAGIEFAKQLVLGFQQAFTEAFPEASGLIGQFVELIKQGIEKVKPIIEKLKEIFNSIVEWLAPVVESVGEWFRAMWELISTVIGVIKDGVTQWLEKHKNEINAVITTIKFVVGNFLTIIKNNIEIALNVIKAVVSTVLNVLKDIIKSATDFWTNIIKAFTAFLKGDWQGAWNYVKQALSSAVEGMMNIFNHLKEGATNVIRSMIDGFMNLFNDLKARFLNFGQDMMDNFVQGITSKIEAVKNTVSNVAQSIKNLIHFTEPDEGPLKDFHTYAPDMMDLFIKGIVDNKDKLRNTVADAFNFGDAIVSPTITQGSAVGGYSQTINISSPEPLTPYEIARQTRIATQDMVLALNV